MRVQLEMLFQSIKQAEYDAVLISQKKNRMYLTGFGSSSGYLLVTCDRAILCENAVFYDSAKSTIDVDLPADVVQTKGDIDKWLPEIVTNLKIRRLAFEKYHLTFEIYNMAGQGLSAAGCDTELVPSEDIVKKLRIVKDEHEIDLLKQAALIADESFADLCSKIQAGMTEREVAWSLEKSLREYGSGPLPFAIIVASGPNAAYPHHNTGQRVISEGEPIVIDFGARVDGYCSDMTRTLCLGSSSKKYRDIYNIVLEAQLTAIKNICVGMEGRKADKLARDIINDHGYTNEFSHALGHGIGLDVHEDPRLSRKSSDLLREYMVFTIEPGIYIPGWGGVRIEDMLVLHSYGPEVITNADKRIK